jgi:lipopolysaccharide biosynthesis glycosyltransferase
MVTPDVTETARAKMRAIGIIVAPVEYLTVKIEHKLGAERPMLKRYPKIRLFVTKWQCLSLVQYDKVFLLDVDMVVLRNIDHIFNQPTPSTKVAFKVGNSGKKYRYQETGSVVSAASANTIMHKAGGGADGGCMLLKPGAAEYKAFINYLDVFDPNKFNTTTTDDECAIFSFYAKRNILWHALDSKWSCIHWKGLGGCTPETSNIMNYIGNEKPWLADLSKYADLKKWYEAFNDLKRRHPGLLQ